MNGKPQTFHAGDRCDVPAGVVHSARMGPHGCQYLIGERRYCCHYMTAKTQRALTADERKLMGFMLSADFFGREELLQQVDSLEVTWVCDCGCGTVNVVATRPVRRSSCREPIPVEAHGSGVDVLLFVRDGLIPSLEIVDHGDSRPLRYPQPNDLELWVPPGGPPGTSS